MNQNELEINELGRLYNRYNKSILFSWYSSSKLNLLMFDMKMIPLRVSNALISVYITGYR
ncbi:hypothetical protein LXL04_010581 [Taraxacum kok-saghyz]